MITVKDLQEKLKEFPEDADVLITWLGHTNGYYRLKKMEGMKVQDPSDGSESTCPVLVFQWNGGVLVLITLYLAVPYAVEGQPTIKEPKTINANRIKNAVRSLVANIKAAVQAPAHNIEKIDFSYAIAA